LILLGWRSARLLRLRWVDGFDKVKAERGIGSAGEQAQRNQHPNAVAGATQKRAALIGKSMTGP
jgi:hypothetical protein